MQNPTSSVRRFAPLLLFVTAALVAGSVAFAMSRGDDGDSSTGNTVAEAADSVPDGSGQGSDVVEQTTIEEINTVAVTGTPLPPLGDVETAAGSAAPNITGVDFGGEPIELFEPGTPTVIAFFAHWCPHCQAEVDALSPYLADSPVREDVRLVAVSTAVKEGEDNYPPSAWFERQNWPTPILVDDETGSAARAFGLNGFPFWAIVDADGKLVARVSGGIGTDRFEQLLDLAAGPA